MFTKADLLPPGGAPPPLRVDVPVQVISAVTGAGVPALLETLWRTLHPRSPTATS